MEQAVKQRLVGAAVLAAIAVITLPMVFDAERPPGVQVQESIPPAPEFPAVTMPEPQPVQLPADRPAGDPVPVADMYQMNSEPPADASVAPAPATQSPPQPTPPAPAANASATANLPPLPAAPGGKLDATGIPESWVVQVAAMSDRKKADSLIAKLKLNGYAAFAHTSHEAAGDTIRVFVGPKLDKAQAVKMKQKLDREMGIQAMVKPFSPK
ncbi:MAG TPA: SPOR domain-containing protein [Pseudomonadales bacterium]|nr:SPOR domain-containing protein [Pseudomonadales bacterium]